MKIFLKKSIALLPFFKYSKNNRFIFLYHNISDKNSILYSPIYTTEINNFKTYIVFLKKYFEFISLDQIVNDDLTKNKNYASIVFDDGFYSTKEIAYPLLSTQNIPFTVFINKNAVEHNRLWVSDIKLNLTNSAFKNAIFPIVKEMSNNLINYESFITSPYEYISTFFSSYLISQIEHYVPINKNKIYLDINDINFLLSKGVKIENHSVNHFILSKCNHNEIKNEICENVSFIKNNFGIDSKHFSIPFGKKVHYNKETIEIAFKSGINYVYTNNPMPLPSQQDYLKTKQKIIPRISILNQSVQELSFLINRTFFKNYNL